MHPIISIITPCYNSATYLANCIESVISQTFKNWEMLVVDDCSTDHSAEIVKMYADQDPRIKYLRTDTPSGGPSVPRNIGLDHAKGEYIAFLDSDDMWLPQKLEEQYYFLTFNKYEFVYSNYEKIAQDGTRSNRIIRVRRISTYWDTIESCSIPCLTVLLSRQLIVLSRFKAIPKEDFAMWLEILRKGTIAHNTNLVHALYRESFNSRSGNKFAMLKEQWYVLRQVEHVKKIPACYFMMVYMIKGYLKYIK